MIYQVELEVDDDKISFAEEFFKSISFVRKVKTIVPKTKPVKKIVPEIKPVTTEFSDKYDGAFNKEQRQSFQALTQELHKDWDYEFMPEMSAEEIIAFLRESRSSGRTRIIEPL